MKKLYTKTQKWLENPDFPEWKVHRIAFGWMLMQYGDLVTVKAGVEEITLKLEHVEGGRPMWYESAPIERELAEGLVGFKLNGDNWRLCIDGSGEPRVNAYAKRSPLGGFPVQPDKVRIVK